MPFPMTAPRGVIQARQQLKSYEVMELVRGKEFLPHTPCFNFSPNFSSRPLNYGRDWTHCSEWC